MLYLFQAELQKKKKGQFPMIYTYFDTMFDFKPASIKSFKIQVCGKINDADRRAKFIKTLVNREIGLEQYNRDISYHRVQSCCRTGAFGLSI